VVKYHKGEFYHEHYDNRADSQLTRAATIIVYLSEHGPGRRHQLPPGAHVPAWLCSFLAASPKGHCGPWRVRHQGVPCEGSRPGVLVSSWREAGGQLRGSYAAAKARRRLITTHTAACCAAYVPLFACAVLWPETPS